MYLDIFHFFDTDDVLFQKPKKKVTINRKRPSTSQFPITPSFPAATCSNPELSSAEEPITDLPSPKKKVLTEERTEGSFGTLISVRDQMYNIVAIEINYYCILSSQSDLAKFAKTKDDLITDNDIEELLTDNAGTCEQPDDSHNDDDLILELEEFDDK